MYGAARREVYRRGGTLPLNLGCSPNLMKGYFNKALITLYRDGLRPAALMFRLSRASEIRLYELVSAGNRVARGLRLHY